MAMAALETEGRVKELAKRQLGNKDLIAEILREAFRDKKEIAVLIDGDKWDMLIENVFGFIKEAYR